MKKEYKLMINLLKEQNKLLRELSENIMEKLNNDDSSEDDDDEMSDSDIDIKVIRVEENEENEENDIEEEEEEYDLPDELLNELSRNQSENDDEESDDETDNEADIKIINIKSELVETEEKKGGKIKKENKKKTKKTPNKFLVFRNEQYKLLKKKNPKMKLSDINKEISKLWKEHKKN